MNQKSSRRKGQPLLLAVIILGLFIGIPFLLIQLSDSEPAQQSGKTNTEATVEQAGTSATKYYGKAQNAEEENYIKDYQRIGNSAQEALQRFTDLISHKPLPELWTREEVLQLAGDTIVIEAAYGEASELAAPPRFEAIHQTWLSGLQKMADAMPAFRDGVTDSDADAVEQATGLILEAAGLISDATRQIKSL